MNNNKVMLIFGFNSEEKEEIDKIIKENKIPGYKVITNEMSKMKIGDILSGLKFEIYNDYLPEEKVIIFNNFNDNEINIAIKNLKQLNRQIIMAVVTPTSIEWSFDYLIQHLIEEREWHEKNRG